MDIWRGLADIPEGFTESVVTIGVFDGVHRGHQSLINTAVQRARELGIASVLTTFDPHPAAVIRPEKMPPLLGTVATRADLAESLGIDHLLALKFTRDLASLEPEDFFNSVLIDALGARVIVVGENFRFGHKAAGDTALMKQLGAARGVEVIVKQLLREDGKRFSSTACRECLSLGDVAGASNILGRPFAVSAVVTRGAGRGGAELGYPTANMYFPETAALPADGVYAGWFSIDSHAPVTGDMERGKRYPAAISVGTNPTFGDERRSVETYVIGRHADLYGHDCTVEFVDFIRGQEKFDSVEQLLDAMARDVALIEERLALQP